MPLIQGNNLMPRVSLLCPPRQKLDSREDGYVKNQGRLLSEWLLNPLHLNISRHILHTFFYTFSMILTMRICLTIKSFFN